MQLATLSELSRMANRAQKTVKRHLERNGIEADAMLLCGSRKPSPLFDPTRESLADILQTHPQILCH